MTRLTIKVKQILKDIEPGGFILVEGPTPRVGVRKLDGTTAIMRQRRIVVGLDHNGEAELNVEPGPLVVRIPYGVDRQRVYTVNVPKQAVANLADLIEEQGADIDDVKPPAHYVTRDEMEELAAGKADIKHTHTIADIERLTADLESLHTGVANSAPRQHKHIIGDIKDLQDKLDALANATPPPPTEVPPHKHTINDVDGLYGRLRKIDLTLDRKAKLGHTHKIEDIEHLSDTLDAINEAARQDTEIWQQAIANTRQRVYEYVEQQTKHLTYDLYAGWEDTGWVQMKAQDSYNGYGTAWQPFSDYDGRRQLISATGYHCSGIRIAEEESVLAEVTYTSEDDRATRDRWAITAMTDNPSTIRVYVRAPKAETVATAAAIRIL